MSYSDNILRCFHDSVSEAVLDGTDVGKVFLFKVLNLKKLKKCKGEAIPVTGPGVP
jgi:hypothetical protein